MASFSGGCFGLVLCSLLLEEAVTACHHCVTVCAAILLRYAGAAIMLCHVRLFTNSSQHRPSGSLPVSVGNSPDSGLLSTVRCSTRATLCDTGCCRLTYGHISVVIRHSHVGSFSKLKQLSNSESNQLYKASRLEDPSFGYAVKLVTKACNWSCQKSTRAGCWPETDHKAVWQPTYSPFDCSRKVLVSC
jgi:hypothetical protein